MYGQNWSPTADTLLIIFVTNIDVATITINGSQLKNPDISGALYTLRIQYSHSQTQCEDGARDVRVL